MSFVYPKKYLGQHFLRDENIAKKIVNALSKKSDLAIMEVGAGTGMLTKYLLEQTETELFVVEIDEDSAEYLKKNYPQLKNNLLKQDFLELDFNAPPFGDRWRGAVIGNFPYNISSQILFKIIKHRDKIYEVVGMFQKEVAQRIAASPGSKTYGILSVLLQTYYHIEYLFTVHENVFIPPPKVKSGVVRLTRNLTAKLDCNEELFFDVVKVSFNQRRKTLKNALKFKFNVENLKSRLISKRAEELSVNDFIELTKLISDTEATY